MIMVLNVEPGWICLMCCNLDSITPIPFFHPLSIPSAVPYCPHASVQTTAYHAQIVLFSVLVLHWLTSKDNASTTPSTPIRSRRLSGYVPVSPPATELNPHPRPTQKKLSNVTTLVTAGQTEFGNAKDMDGDVRYPANAITVSREMVRAVDRLSDTMILDGEGLQRDREAYGKCEGEREMGSEGGLYE